MSRTSCSQESAVAQAVRSGVWGESLETHLRECSVCRDVQATARWMRALSEDVGRRTDLPGPQVLWLRAQLSHRQAAAERASTVLQWVEILCVTAACVGFLVWLAWNWSGIGEIADRFGWALFDAWPALWAGISAYGPLNAPILFSSALAAIALVALGVAYPLLVRE
jgi:hypothetical protein